MKRIKQKYNYAGYLYILPWILGFLLLQLVPLISSLWYSFTDYQMIGTPKFVGLENYAKAFKSPEFWKYLKVT